MRAQLINEKFEDESDPITDMGIGLKPKEVLPQFMLDLKKLGFDFKIDTDGHTYDTEVDEIYTFIFGEMDKSTLLGKLLFDHEYFELIFATTNRAAEHVIKNSKWGFFYWDRGTVKYLKNAKDIKEVIKQICKIRHVTISQLDNMMQWQKKQIKTIENIRDIIQ